MHSAIFLCYLAADLYLWKRHFITVLTKLGTKCEARISLVLKSINKLKKNKALIITRTSNHNSVIPSLKQKAQLKDRQNRTTVKPLKAIDLSQNQVIIGGPRIIIDSTPRDLCNVFKICKNLKMKNMREKDLYSSRSNFQRGHQRRRQTHKRKVRILGNNMSPIYYRNKLNSWSSEQKNQISSTKSSPKIRDQENSFLVPHSYTSSYMSFLNQSSVQEGSEGLRSNQSPSQVPHQHLPDIVTEERSIIRAMLSKSESLRKAKNYSRATSKYHKF